MNAASMLANALLEMHVVNPQEFDRRIRMLAATVSEPRAARWLTRVARYMVQNMDALATEPYTPEPKPHLDTAGLHGTKHPFGPVEPDKLPVGKMSKDLLLMLHGAGAGGGERLTNWGLLDPKEGKRPSWWQDKEPEGNSKVKVPWVKHTTPEGEKVEAEVPEADFERWHSPAYRAVKESLAEAEEYSTNLHHPVWSKHIDQEFQPYTTKKAPKGKSVIHRGPPPAANAPEWIKQKEANKEPGETFFWEPQRARDRELWKKLEMLVEYFNYLDYARKHYPKSDNAEERAEAAEGEALFKQLEPMKNSDITGFLRVLTKAQEFKDRARGISMRHSMKLVSTVGSLQLFSLNTVDAVLAVSNQASKWYGGKHPNWCTHSSYNAENYFKQGNGRMFVVMKEGDPYALFTPGAGYFKDVRDRSIDDNQAAEIAPLFKGWTAAALTGKTSGDVHRIREIVAGQAPGEDEPAPDEG